MGKLDNDLASREARPSAPSPAKLAKTRHTAFDASKVPAWLAAAAPLSAAGAEASEVGGSGCCCHAGALSLMFGMQWHTIGPRQQAGKHETLLCESFGHVLRLQASPPPSAGQKRPTDVLDFYTSIYQQPPAKRAATSTAVAAGAAPALGARVAPPDGGAAAAACEDAGAGADCGDELVLELTQSRPAEQPQQQVVDQQQHADQQQQQQPPPPPMRQQPGPARLAAGPRHAPGGARATSPPIQALPPAADLDPAVLAELPLSVRRELERAYGAWGGVDGVGGEPCMRGSEGGLPAGAPGRAKGELEQAGELA